MPWKLIIQSNNKRTKFEPKGLYNLQDDPAEKQNRIESPEGKSLTDSMLKEYLEIVDSGRPTASQ